MPKCDSAQAAHVAYTLCLSIILHARNTAFLFCYPVTTTSRVSRLMLNHVPTTKMGRDLISHRGTMAGRSCKRLALGEPKEDSYCTAAEGCASTGRVRMRYKCISFF